MITVLLVDDHSLVRSAIKQLLSGAGDIKVIGEVGSGHEAIKFVREKQPQIVLLDISMPGMSGLETTYRLLRFASKPKVVVVTTYQNPPFPSLFIKAGVHGYVPKGANAKDLITAIHAVAKGDQYIHPEIAQRLALDMMQTGDSPFEEFNHREFEVFWMLCHRMSVDAIAKELFLSKKTVHSYRYRIFKKLKVSNDVELIKFAMQHGLVD